MRMNLLEISRCTESVCVGMSATAALTRPTGAAIDSRAVKEGNLFFCLPGENADGHNFAAQAVAKGALAIIGTRNPFGKGTSPVPVFIVEDAVTALGQAGAEHRRRSDAIVIGVTGTSGKTSVKEVLASVLSEQGETEKNSVNLNNQIGLPLSMLNASSNAMYWVMEAGISEAKDMDDLGSMLRPDIALILNAGSGHTQGLGGKGVAYYKAHLLAYLAPDGKGIVSADYPDLVKEAKVYGADLIFFSAKDEGYAYCAAYLGPETETAGKYSLFMDGSELTVRAPFQGVYGAENVAAISAVAGLLGLTETEIAKGFASAQLPGQRFSLKEAGAFLVIDDTYNANPLSMIRMLDAANDMARARGEALILVLGEMAELGPESAAHHEELGRHVGKLSPGAVFWKGGKGDAVLRGLEAAGYMGSFIPVADVTVFGSGFREAAFDSGVVLFKGSRSNKLEELVAAFMPIAALAGTEKGSHDAV